MASKLAAPLGYALVSFLLLGWSLTSSKVLLPADVLYSTVPLLSEKGRNPPQNAVLSDAIEQFFPYHHFFREELSQGRFPLWNPYVLSGTPFVATTVSAVLAPLHWILIFLPIGMFYEWAAFLKLVIAGTGIFYYSRRIGLEQWAAFASGLAYLFSGYCIYFLLFPNSWIAALFGWGLLTVERYIETLQIRNLGFLMLVMGAAYLGGHVESAVLLHLSLLGYAAIRAWKRLLPILAASVIGLLMGAAVLFPFVEFLFESATYELRSVSIRNPYHLSLRSLPALLIPYFVGSPLGREGAVPYELMEGAIYMGILPLFFLPFSFLHQGCRRQTFALAGLLIWSFFILFGLPPLFDLFTVLPFLRQGNHFHVAQIFQGVSAALAGIGVSAVLRGEVRIRLLVVGATVCTVLILLLIRLQIDPDWSRDAELGSYFFLYRRFGIPLYPLWVGVTLMAAIATLRWRLWSLVVCVILTVNGLAFGFYFNPVVSAWDTIELTPPLVRELQETPHDRFVALGIGHFTPNYGMRWKLRDIRGYESVVAQRVPPVYKRLTGGKIDHHQFLTSLNPEIIQLLRRLGSRFLLSPEAHTSNDLVLIREGFPLVYEIRDSGRVMLAQRITPARLAEEALSHILSEPDWTNVVIEDEESNLTPLKFSGEGTIEWVRDEPDVVELRVRVGQDQCLVLRDTLMPGWSATLDGKEATILRADYLFRAVMLPPGSHRLRFEYRPVSFYLGCIVSLSSLILALGACAVQEGGRRRRRRPDE